MGIVPLPKRYVVPDTTGSSSCPLFPTWLRTAILLLISAGGPLIVYGRTAAPGVLSGDGAELQFAAYVSGVPHPTGYPLYIMLARLAISLLPIGEPAYRVTLVSVGGGALTVALLAFLLVRITGKFFAALIGAIALAVAPGFWGTANQAEVYTLNTLLLVLLAWLLWESHCPSSPLPRRWSRSLATLVAGFGFTHHGSFAFIGLPLFLCFGLIAWYWPKWRTVLRVVAPFPSPTNHRLARQFIAEAATLVAAGMVGFLPWVWVFIQYMRMGPFDGLRHGLRPGLVGAEATYFWGSPVNLGQVVDHLLGGQMRQDIFRLPEVHRLMHKFTLVGDRLPFELGSIGMILGGIGLLSLLRSRRWIGVASILVVGTTLGYFISLGEAVQDAAVFLLPWLLPWSLWIGVGSDVVARSAGWLWERIRDHVFPRFPSCLSPSAIACLPSSVIASGVSLILVLLVLRWGDSRLPYTNKAHLQVFREFAEESLQRVEPNAVIISRWEQGTTLLYLHLVERQRPDVRIEVVEPEDEAWLELIRQRYAEQVVYGVGNAHDVAVLSAEPVWQTEYAILFRFTAHGKDSDVSECPKPRWQDEQVS